LLEIAAKKLAFDVSRDNWGLRGYNRLGRSRKIGEPLRAVCWGVGEKKKYGKGLGEWKVH